jgi:KDO2-lipid IV(A) lauroyltransferase
VTPLRALRERLEYAALLAGECFLLSMPPRVADEIVRGAARAFYRIDGRRRRTTLENLRVAFGDAMPAPAREALARRAFEHAFQTALDLARGPRYLRSARAMRRRVRLTGDFDRLLADARAGRGGVMLSAHLGNWELIGPRLRRERVRVRLVTRRVENSLLDARAATWRGAGDDDVVIDKRGAVRSALRALREGAWVGLLADQNAGRAGEFVPFFGLPASTSPIAALLAVRSGAPLYMGVVRRVGPGYRYEAIFHRYEVDPSADRHVEEERLMTAYAARVETWARTWPEQYMWLHRRWKTRPPGEVPGPHLPTYDRRKPAKAPASLRGGAAARTEPARAGL